MQEKIVRQVMIKYFALKGIRAIPSRGAGPDLIIDGKAVEVKGTKYNFDRMLRQLVDYAYKYSNLALALPFDGLTLKRIEQISMFDGLIRETRSISLKMYIIAPAEQKNFFYIYDSPTVDRIRAMMTALSSGYPSGFSLKEPDATIKIAVENLLKYSPVQLLKKYVCTDYDHKVSKVQIDI